MPLPRSRIRNGFTYQTASGQVRKVLKIAKGKVYYMARGRQAGSNRWGIGHTLANPPSLNTFATAVAKRIIPTPQDAIPAAKEMRRLLKGYPKKG